MSAETPNDAKQLELYGLPTVAVRCPFCADAQQWVKDEQTTRDLLERHIAWNHQFLVDRLCGVR